MGNGEDASHQRQASQLIHWKLLVHACGKFSYESTRYESSEPIRGKTREKEEICTIFGGVLLCRERIQGMNAREEISGIGWKNLCTSEDVFVNEECCLCNLARVISHNSPVFELGFNFGFFLFLINFEQI